MKISLSSFVINPSINVSPYCYSILRVESYPSCEHECVYCYGRWYRGGELNEGRYDVIWSFKKLLQRLKDASLKSIPFRLSTLVDPFQPREEGLKVSMKIMRLCLKYDVPLIVNTKSTLLLKDEYLATLKELSSRGLALVQISLSTVSQEAAKVLEPRAPPPNARLEAAERLAEEGVPVLIRLQPFIPGVSDREAEEVVEGAHQAGVKQIIVESLREEASRLSLYRGLAHDGSIYDRRDEWEQYSSTEGPRGILRPSARWRVAAYSKIKELCDKRGIKFATCKEGLYEYHTAEDCCGMYLLDKEKYALRPTLFEAWRYCRERGYVPTFEELVEGLSDAYLFGEAVKRYPRPLRRKMVSHEKILRRVLSRERGEPKLRLPTTVC